MPRYSLVVHKRMHHKRNQMRGKGLFDWIKKAHDFIKKHKLISTVSGALSHLHPAVAATHRISSLAGYGRRRHMGGSLRVAGGALRLSGARGYGRRRVYRRRRLV